MENCIASRIMHIVRPQNAARLRHHVPSSHRYPIRAAVEYRLTGHDWYLKNGAGWTISLSSRSVLIESETGLPLNRRVDLWIEWPVSLDNKAGLRLHIDGRTVNAAGTATEVEILAYEFRTRALPPRRTNQTSDAVMARWPEANSTRPSYGRYSRPDPGAPPQTAGSRRVAVSSGKGVLHTVN